MAPSQTSMSTFLPNLPTNLPASRHLIRALPPLRIRQLPQWRLPARTSLDEFRRARTGEREGGSVRVTGGGAAVNAAREGSVALLRTSELARPFFPLLRLARHSTSFDAFLRPRRPTNSLNLLLPAETLLPPNLLALATRSSVTFSTARVKTAREGGEVRFVAGFEGFFDGEGGGSRRFAVVEGGTADADGGRGTVTAFCR
jgi:hypothetical protein